MAVGSSSYNIGYIFIVFNLWFAFAILFRESFDSPHPQGSWSHDWMVVWFCIAMVPWFGGHSSFPTPIAINISALLFVHSPCHVFNHSLLYYWWEMSHDLVYTRSWTCFIFSLRLSFRATDDFPSFPFSGTHYVLRHNVFRATNLTGQLYLVCKLCWIHLRRISTLCASCEFFNNIGFELEIL